MHTATSLHRFTVDALRSQPFSLVLNPVLNEDPPRVAVVYTRVPRPSRGIPEKGRSSCLSFVSMHRATSVPATSAPSLVATGMTLKM